MQPSHASASGSHMHIHVHAGATEMNEDTSMSDARKRGRTNVSADDSTLPVRAGVRLFDGHHARDVEHGSAEHGLRSVASMDREIWSCPITPTATRAHTPRWERETRARE